MRNARTQQPHRRRALLASLAAASLLLPLLLQTPAGAAGPGCTSPPSVVDDPSAVAMHTTGTGYTTIEGSSPTTFDVDVLGVMPDGIMLDVDLIVARITGPQEFFDNAGGIFYGMSGSPVYINGDKDTGDLLGAVSYSYWPDQTIIGLTPGAAMLDMFDLPTSNSPSLATRVDVTRSMQRTLASTGTSVDDTSGTFEQMPTMLGVPLQGTRLREFRKLVDADQTGVRVVHAGIAAASTIPVSGDDFGVGEPVSSILSYGDASIWAAGTVTIVCGNDQVAMYGHPLFWDTPGPVTLGLNGVEVLGISHSAAWWNEMIPVVTDTRGSVTADRFTGEVGQVGLAPVSFPITSDFASPDTGLSRLGGTDAVYDKSWWFEYEVWIHMFLNLDAVFQRISPGTSNLDWTLSFEDADANPYQVVNHVHAYSSWDATEGIWKLLSEIDQLSFNDFGQVTFTGLDATGSITAVNETAPIVRVRTASGMQDALRSRRVLRVHAGRRVTVEVTQEPVEGGADVVTTFSLKVPRGWHGDHRVTVRGGNDQYWSRGADSLAELVDQLNGGEQADDLIVQGIGRRATQRSSLIVDGKVRFTIDVVG